MDPSNYPSKKPRLDLDNKSPGSSAFGEELWDQDEITAEEFDMLQTQVPQPINTAATGNQACVFPATDVISHVPKLELDNMKQQQFELEGKMKILSTSLEKVTKELREERVKRNSIICEKMKEFDLKENALKKENQKLQSILQFKEHEIKTVYDKMNTLESQEKAKISVAMPSTSHATPNKFLKKLSFSNKPTAKPPESKVPTPIQEKMNVVRKYKFSKNFPSGQNVASLLCNRLDNSYKVDNFPLNTIPHSLEVVKPVPLSASSVTRLEVGQVTEQLWKYYSSFLGIHVSVLSHMPRCNTYKIWMSHSQLVLFKNQVNANQRVVISNLKDLTCLLSSQQLPDISFPSIEDSIPVFVSGQSHKPVDSLLTSLLALANPSTYPPNYSKEEEIERSLAVLISWSSLCPQRFIPHIQKLPLNFFLENLRYSHLALKLLTTLAVCEEFKGILFHNDDDCFLCAVGNLAFYQLPSTPLRNAALIIRVEDFLTTLFTTHFSINTKFSCSPCSAKICEGLIRLLLKYYEKENNLQKSDILNKGLVLLHIMSTHMLKFKEERICVDQRYIFLISSIVSHCKEHDIFREYQDVLLDLWDFEATNEFDDEGSED